uniref:Actin n=1 Tax=Syphacia muris TaxID=451379 RepID=A0A0N5AM89_9BILA
MSGGLYGGDEVGALVFDAGSHSFRVGFAGEEYPKGDLPSQVGIQELVDKVDNTIDQPDDTKKIRKYYIGSTQLGVPRTNMEIASLTKDGMIEDWDIFEQLVDYAYKRVLNAESQYQPVLFTEPAWNVSPKREKLIELMFEKYNVPAFYLIKNAVLACFANGRTAGLIVDSGASQTSAVPVYDGYCVNRGVVKSPIGGDLIAEQCRLMCEEQSIEVVPAYKIASKAVVNEGEKPVWVPKKNLPQVTKSFEAYMKKQVLEDLASTVLQCCDTPIDVEYAEKLPSSPFCFPCGFSKEFQAERIKIPEGLFDLNYLKNVNTEALMSVSQIAVTSCGMCDIDMRPSLYSGLVVTGGNSFLMGFTERLNHDLAHKCPPAMKLRVSAAPTSLERRFGAWIGGSILASLGTFQQMWISRSEYDDTGKGIVDKKCN